MSKMENEPRDSVQGGCGDGDGGEEQRRVDGTIAGSVTGEGGLWIHEARSTEIPNASTVLPTQFTIFFGGNVSVFEGISAEKIQEIFGIAAAAAKSIETKNSKNISPVTSPALNRAPSFSSTSTAASPAAQSFTMQPMSFCRSAADLPIARRHSLQRFLEKRRDRLVNKNPYPASDMKKTDVQTDNNASIKKEYPTV
ncbi:hypothetical protein AALP_AA8G230800 [Arabis alpina]|uniref:Protein TIFY n=1 Tax=Arabis alpina TaxID=50452 RepID=A0A087G8V6_ARAAL|nr:hypothetical protein AALP_AA8G230800 [Arabis alpina]